MGAACYKCKDAESGKPGSGSETQNNGNHDNPNKAGATPAKLDNVFKGGFTEAYELKKKVASGHWEAVKKRDLSTVSVIKFTGDNHLSYDLLDDAHALKVMKAAKESNDKTVTLVPVSAIYHTKEELAVVFAPWLGMSYAEAVSKRESYSESDVANAMSQVVDALSILHQLGLVHGNLRISDILVLEGKDLQLKLGNYGTYEFVKRSSWQGPQYLSPESIEKKPITKATDVWNLGMVLYMMLVGYLPQGMDTAIEVEQKHTDNAVSKICAGTMPYAGTYWDEISDDAKNMVQSLLKAQPSNRPPILEVKDDFFLVSHNIPFEHLTETHRKFSDIAGGVKGV